jgi:hypothetical protein
MIYYLVEAPEAFEHQVTNYISHGILPYRVHQSGNQENNFWITNYGNIKFQIWANFSANQNNLY